MDGEGATMTLLFMPRLDHRTLPPPPLIIKKRACRSGRDAMTLDLLRFTTAGSVDDGKSTLIGRLLYDTKQVFEDQLQHVAQASERRGGAGALDLALLTDGLRAEREQGITIDVAYRYFATPRAPVHHRRLSRPPAVHAQHGHGRVHGRPVGDPAGRAQGRARAVQAPRLHQRAARHPHLVVAVNKMDLVEHSQARFRGWSGVRRIRAQPRRDRQREGTAERNIAYIPISALNGDNVVERSPLMTWYDGPTLLELLERSRSPTTTPTTRPHGCPCSGLSARRAQRAGIGRATTAATPASWPAARCVGARRWRCCRADARTRIAAIDTFDGELEKALAPMSVTLRLEDELDVSRGELICRPDQAPTVARELAGRRVLDERATAAPRRALSDQAHHAQRRRDRRRAARPASTYARWSAPTSPPQSSRSTTSAASACAPAARSCSTHTSATAAPAASS